MDEIDLNRRLENMEALLNKILGILNGNGKAGLITETALLKQKVEDLPKPAQLKWYAGIGGGVVTAVGLVLFLITHSIKSLWG